MGGFLSPKSGASVPRSGHVVTVTFRLAGITASLAAKLAAAGGVGVTLSGPGISAVTVMAPWQAKTGTFGARISIPAKIKTGVNYALTVRENVRIGLEVVPAIGKAVDPGSIRFS